MNGAEATESDLGEEMPNRLMLTYDLGDVSLAGLGFDPGPHEGVNHSRCLGNMNWKDERIKELHLILRLEQQQQQKPEALGLFGGIRVWDVLCLLNEAPVGCEEAPAGGGSMR